MSIVISMDLSNTPKAAYYKLAETVVEEQHWG